MRRCPSARVFTVSAAPACPPRQKNSPTRTRGAGITRPRRREAPTSPARTSTRRPAAAGPADAPPAAASHAPRSRRARTFWNCPACAGTPRRTPNRSRAARSRPPPPDGDTDDRTSAAACAGTPTERRTPRSGPGQARAPAPDPGTADRRRSRAVDDLEAEDAGRIARTADTEDRHPPYLPLPPPVARSGRRAAGAEPGSPGAVALREPNRAPGVRSSVRPFKSISHREIKNVDRSCGPTDPRAAPARGEPKHPPHRTRHPAKAATIASRRAHDDRTAIKPQTYAEAANGPPRPAHPRRTEVCRGVAGAGCPRPNARPGCSPLRHAAFGPSDHRKAREPVPESPCPSAREPMPESPCPGALAREPGRPSKPGPRLLTPSTIGPPEPAHAQGPRMTRPPTPAKRDDRNAPRSPSTSPSPRRQGRAAPRQAGHPRSAGHHRHACRSVAFWCPFPRHHRAARARRTRHRVAFGREARPPAPLVSEPRPGRPPAPLSRPEQLPQAAGPCAQDDRFS